MTPLEAQWDELVALEPSDWSHLMLELRLDDLDRMEDAVVVLSPLNPWRRDDDFRSGLVRFRAARHEGYGAAPGLVRRRLGQLDEASIAGRVRALRSVEAARLVHTQGPR